MKIYNISQANYQTQTNKSKQPTFSARMKLDREVQLIHDLEKLDLISGLNLRTNTKISTVEKESSKNNNIEEEN